MKRPLRILLIEDSEEDAELLLAEIDNSDFEAAHLRVYTPESTLQALESAQWDIAISDYTMPRFSGLEALALVRQHDPDMPFIIISGNIGEDIAVEAMRAGAQDYLMKGNLSRLAPAIERELRDCAVRRDARRAQARLEENEARFRAMVSNIPGMVFQLLQDGQDNLGFTYASEGSQQLLGLSFLQLRTDSAIFFGRLADQGENALRHRIVNCAKTLSPFTWEGRIHGPANDSVRWLEVRMSPRRLGKDQIQWEGILADVSQRKQAEADLLQSQSQLSALSAHLQKVKETERTNIACIVHDDIGGNLTAIKIDLLWLINRVGDAGPELLAKAKFLDLLADQTMEIATRIARDLRPPLLDQGLLAAIEWQAADFSKRMDIPCLVRCKEGDIAADPELASALFSVFREILTNISKHAGATRVEVVLDTNGANCTLSVIDNGCGIIQTDLLKKDSFGLRGMLERARNLGGEIRFDGDPGLGTTVTVRMPLTAPAAPA